MEKLLFSNVSELEKTLGISVLKDEILEILELSTGMVFNHVGNTLKLRYYGVKYNIDFQIILAHDSENNLKYEVIQDIELVETAEISTNIVYFSKLISVIDLFKSDTSFYLGL